MTMNLLPEFIPGMPEIFLSLMIMSLLMLGVFKKQDALPYVFNLSLVALVVCFVMTILVKDHQQIAFHGMFVTNKFTQLAKALILIAVIAVMVMTSQHLEREKLSKFEYPILLLFATLGMMAMVSANDLIAMFMSIEVQSLSLYIAVALARSRLAASEAGIKYFVLGALSTAFILFGSGLIYWFTGTIEFQGIASVLKASSIETPWVITAFIMVFIGIGFKLSWVPFHMWTPDVYEGSPTPVTSFLAAAPKIAAFALLMRILIQAFGPLEFTWKAALVFFALASIALGAFTALFQRNLKRLLAYSTISHMGFAVLGLLAAGVVAIQNVLIYLILYVTATIGAFGCLLNFNRYGRALENIDELTGLSKDSPVLAACFTILLFSLAGVPPFGGFFAKLGVFKNAIEAGYYTTVVIGVLASVVSAAYYLKIVKVMYFDEPLGGELALKIDRPFSKQTQFVIILATSVIAFYVLFPNYISDQAKAAATYLILGSKC
jgi:NADH-quinone oxidoreductase subunit N